MKFAQCTFDVFTKTTKDADARKTTITLTADEVPDDMVRDVMIGGNSPRVAWQNRTRDAGPAPEAVTLSWSEWLTPTRRTRSANVPETPEQIAARAKADPEYMKRVLELLNAK